MGTIHIETSNGKNCTKCNKSNVCKFKDTVEDHVKMMISTLEKQELPLAVSINCREWSGELELKRSFWWGGFNWLKLFFQNSKGEERLIATPTNREEVNKEIDKFLDEHNFKSYYTRVWEADGRLIFDVGSWSEVFILEGITFEKDRKSVV